VAITVWAVNIDRPDILNGWQSRWHQSFNQIDKEAEEFFEQYTGRKYMIGDNCYSEMREAIQS